MYRSLNHKFYSFKNITLIEVSNHAQIIVTQMYIIEKPTGKMNQKLKFVINK